MWEVGGPRDESHLQRQAGLPLAGEFSRRSLSLWGRGVEGRGDGSDGGWGGGVVGAQESG